MSQSTILSRIATPAIFPEEKKESAIAFLRSAVSY
jgi:hypothetical protein